MGTHGVFQVFQVKLGDSRMKALRDHAVFAANIKRTRSKHFLAGQDGIFPGSYLRFVKRGDAWELDDNHADSVKLGFSNKLMCEFAAK